jgi:hypothetical protein
LADPGILKHQPFLRNDALEDGHSLHPGEKLFTRFQHLFFDGENLDEQNTDCTFLQAYEPIEKANKFFKSGRVFCALWVEPAGPSSQDDVNNNITKINYDQRAFAKPSRFISIRNQKGFCVALRINTFGGRGGSKFTHRPPHLFFVHSVDEAEDISWLGTNVIAVKVEDPDITFTVGKSVVLASKPYSVEHFLSIRNIGYVVKSSLGKLESALLESLGKPSSQSSTATTKKAATWPNPDPKRPKQSGQLEGNLSLQSSRDYTTSQIPMLSGDNLASHGRTSQEVVAHRENVEKESYSCDYRCPKQGQSFYRIEHLRDHLRDYHLEDIPRNRKFGDESKRIDWYNSREVHKDWWRCKACLEKVHSSQYGWRCPTCRLPCEQDRVNHRMQQYPGYCDEVSFPIVSADSRTSCGESRSGSAAGPSS